MLPIITHLSSDKKENHSCRLGYKSDFSDYSISKASLSCLFGRTRESRIPIIAGTNHGREASANGRAFTIFARTSTLKVDPKTLAIAMAVTIQQLIAFLVLKEQQTGSQSQS